MLSILQLNSNCPINFVVMEINYSASVDLVLMTGISTAVISFFFFRHPRHSMGFLLPWQDVGTTWLGTVVDLVSGWEGGSCGEK